MQTPNGAELLEQHLDRVVWADLSFVRDKAFIVRHQDRVTQWYLCFKYPELQEMVERNLEKLSPREWSMLSQHAAYIHVLREFPMFICWDWLSQNQAAVELLEQNLDKVEWSALSKNAGAVGLLSRHLDKIDWKQASRNEAAVDLLEQNLDKVDWECVSYNPGAWSLLRQHVDKISWRWFTQNPIFLTSTVFLVCE
jgi:hypothetical protein